jgi:hypothetical protein
LDSAPILGAGRVEDTFNLLGHALEIVVDCAAHVLAVDRSVVLAEAKLELLGRSSIKGALDIDWDNETQKNEALSRLLAEARRLRQWIGTTFKDTKNHPPLDEALALVERILAQDLEPDPGGSDGALRIKNGVAKDRRISVTDPDMRHGRKSKSRLFNGFKRHVARDLDSALILAATVRPANESEHLAADLLRPDIERIGPVAELHIDRGYLASAWISARFDSGERILAKPWTPKNGDKFPKTAFHIDLDGGWVRCPEDRIATISGAVASFAAAHCDHCESRERCTRAQLGQGRTITIHPKERLLVQLRVAKSTPEGRKELRQRVGIEHTLALVVRRQGPRARYKGTRKNVFDLCRTCAVENLHTLDRISRAA